MKKALIIFISIISVFFIGQKTSANNTFPGDNINPGVFTGNDGYFEFDTIDPLLTQYYSYSGSVFNTSTVIMSSSGGVGFLNGVTSSLYFLSSGTGTFWASFLANASSTYQWWYWIEWNWDGTEITIDGQSLNGNTVNSDYLILNPISPADCYYNENAFSGNAIGTITSPSSSLIHWYAIEMAANDYWTGERVYSSTTISLDAGQTVGYSIPYSLSSATLWEIFYIVYGYNTETGLYHYVTHTNLSCGEDSDFTTWIGSPASSTLELLQCDIDLLGDDCSSTSYSVIEKFTCEISETMRGTFIPSCSARAKLDRYQNAIKQYAPYNYISAFNIFLQSFFIPTTTATTFISFVTAAEKFSQFDFFISLRLLLKYLEYIGLVIILIIIIKKMFK